MSKRQFIFIIPLYVLFYSCSGFSKFPNTSEMHSLEDSTFFSHNGLYKNKSISSTDASSTEFHWKVFNINKEISDSIETFELRRVSNRIIVAKFYSNEKLLWTKQINGKLVDGYFEVRSRHLVLPALIVNLFRTTKFRFGVLKNGNLITDYSQTIFGNVCFVFFFREKIEDLNCEYELLTQ